MEDNKENKSYSFKEKMNIAFVAILIIAIIALFIFHIIAEDPSDTETFLFAFLQFIFSSFLAWILANYSSKKEFEKSQEKFALSAYRRIEEIKENVDSLILAATNVSGPSESNELELIKIIGGNIQRTIESSVADWGDIIGETVDKLNEISDLKKELAKTKNSSDANKIELEKKENKIKELEESLPKTLRVKSQSSDLDIFQTDPDTALFKHSLEAENFYFEIEDKQIRDELLSQVNLGTMVNVELENIFSPDAKSSIKLENGYNGTLVNPYFCPDANFLRAIYKWYKSSSIKGELIETKRIEDNGFIYQNYIIKCKVRQ